MNHDFEKLLKDQNLSITAVRLAVLEALHARPHADAAVIFDLVKARIATTSLQAVYNNLHTMVEHGIVREIKPKGQSSLYEMCHDDNHHHIVCRSCHAIADAQCQTNKPCLSPVDNHGFAIDEAEVIFWGLCPSCQSTPKGESKNG